MTGWMLISLVWFGLAAGMLALLIQRYRTLKPLEAPAREPESWPQVSVIIPVRNEAACIEGCLEDLAAQHYTPSRLEVHVVDDGSTDGTGELAARYAEQQAGFHLHTAGPLPSGWLGKPHACWVGAGAAHGDWLCFLDADTRLAPDLLETAVARAEAEQVDLLSLHPRQEMIGFWERLLMPLPFMTLMILLDASRINDPASRRAMANGQFILVRRSAYDAVDGHRSIRSAVLDDVRLAERVKWSGRRILLLGGADLIRTRMYRDLSSLWQALARGGTELFGVPLTFTAAISSLVTAIFPLAFPIWLAGERGSGNALALALAIIGSSLWYLMHALELRRHQVPLGYMLALPLSYVLIALVNLEGVLRRAFGRRLWKGRLV